MNGTVTYTAHDAVGVITLNRPDTKNAINLALAEDLVDAYRRLDRDASIAVGVLTGAGGSFCAGLDLTAVLSGEIDPSASTALAELFDAAPSKPLIAAVEGFALGGGFELLLNADLIVASTTARFGLPEVKLGLIAAGGALLRLGHRIPFHRAMDLALTGRQVRAAELSELGLVSTITEAGEALQTAVEQAAAIAENAPLSLAATKRILLAASAASEADARRVQADLIPNIFSSTDAIEGAIAFAERRQPQWNGV